jgi:hypothetical protein
VFGDIYGAGKGLFNTFFGDSSNPTPYSSLDEFF